MRLDKFLSSQMNMSRTDAKKALRSGSVSVNGIPEKKGERQVDPDSDHIALNGKIIQYKKYLYLMMNKPGGVISSSEKGVHQTTVIDLVPEEFYRSGLFPAGRLDKDTTGFVLITDDGAFAHDILSPARHVPKTYLVSLRREMTVGEIELMEKGMEIDGESLQPAELKKIGNEGFLYQIVIRQGIYHQIKRMFSSCGNEVLTLRRIRIGGLALDENLSPGECREITSDELKMLRSEA